MQIKTEIINRIAAIQVKADLDKTNIQTKADRMKAELQAILDTNEAWLLRETDLFQTKINRVVALVRQKE